MAGSLEVDLGHLPVLEDRDALLADLDRHENLFANVRRCRAFRRSPRPSARLRLLLLLLFLRRLYGCGRSGVGGLLLSAAAAARSAPAPGLCVRRLGCFCRRQLLDGFRRGCRGRRLLFS
jgi:hypothetical protein